MCLVVWVLHTEGTYSCFQERHLITTLGINNHIEHQLHNDIESKLSGRLSRQRTTIFPLLEMDFTSPNKVQRTSFVTFLYFFRTLNIFLCMVQTISQIIHKHRLIIFTISKFFLFLLWLHLLPPYILCNFAS